MRPEPLLKLPDPDWIDLLRAEIDKGRSVAEVASQIGMPRPSLSMLLSGTYPAKLDKVTRKFAPKVVSLFRGQVLCPHLRQSLTDEACRKHAGMPMSTSNPDKLSQWQACRKCPLNPLSGDAK